MMGNEVSVGSDTEMICSLLAVYIYFNHYFFFSNPPVKPGLVELHLPFPL